MDEEVVLTAVVDVTEIEIETGEDVQAGGRRLGTDVGRAQRGEHDHEQRHKAGASAEDVALGHSVKMFTCTKMQNYIKKTD